MIKKEFEKFEYEIIAEDPVDFYQNLKIFEEMVKFAKELGKFPPEDYIKNWLKIFSETLEVDLVKRWKDLKNSLQLK